MFNFVIIYHILTIVWYMLVNIAPEPARNLHQTYLLVYNSNHHRPNPLGLQAHVQQVHSQGFLTEFLEG